MSRRIRRRGWRAICAALALAVAAAASGQAQAERILVFAAASATTALNAAAARFTAETGHEVVVSPAGSSALARQIQQGAPADLFLSANTLWMDALDAEGLIAPDSRTDLLGNRLALIAPGAAAPAVAIGPGLDLPGLLDGGRLAMALVDAVPAGMYGKAALTALGLWDGVAAQIAQADNVRAALAFVAAGEAPLGIVYVTDAAAERSVSVIGVFPAETHPPIVYPAAIVAGRDRPPVRALLAFLRGPEARAAFEAQGFAVLGE